MTTENTPKGKDCKGFVLSGHRFPAFAVPDFDYYFDVTQEEISNIKWRNDGKIARIERSGSTAKTIEFGYNPSGHRISKKILSGNTWEETTYYIRDAQV